MIEFIDGFLTEIIKDIKPAKRKWYVVEKYYSGGKAGVSFTGCELVFEDSRGFERIGTNKQPYIRICGDGDKKIVEGYGYITGVTPSGVRAVFDGELINEANISRLEIDPLVIDGNTLHNPVEFLSGVLGTRKFIFSPESYVALLNKYFMNRTVLERRNSSRCLLCGRKMDVSTGDICSTHFDYTQN